VGQSFVNDVDLAEGCNSPRLIYFECKECKRLVKVSIGCGKRFESFCPSCAARWRRRTFAKYYKGVLSMKTPKFLTLTLKKTGGRIEKRLLELWSMKKYLFKQLKRRGYSIPSWCGVIEPPNHIHLVVDCQYIPQRVISELWMEITGDSFIIDIRKVNANDLRQVAAYITKYLTKASNWEGVNLDLLKGFHLIGSWRLPPRAPPQAICICGVRNLQKLPEDGYYALFMYQERKIASELAELWRCPTKTV